MEILSSMEATTAAVAAIRQLLPPRKYTSVFRIDGVPILPPLMTSEKRKQMRKLREQAMELEQRLKVQRSKRKQFQEQEQLHCHEAETLKTNSPATPPAAEECHTERSSISSCSATQRALQLQQDDDSYLMLSNLMGNNTKERKILADSSNCTQTDNYKSVAVREDERERCMEKRMQKLQKSETLIYDNCSNTIILPISRQEEEQEEEKQQQRAKAAHDAYELQEVLANTSTACHTHGNKQLIPSICVDPPTPLLATRSFCDTLSFSESFDSVENIDLKLLPKCLSDALSSDDSLSYSQSISLGSHALKAHKKVTNITAKIIQFESLREDNNVGKSPPKRKSLEPPSTKLPQRSATSPSLKPISPNITFNSPSFNSSEAVLAGNPIVRSNSFTLDCPSKALVEHLRQQKAAAVAAQQQCPSKHRCFPSPSATRDTVESKAKRVQKVQLNPQQQAMRGSTKKHSAVAGSSPAVSNNSSNTGVKHKHSPYELKSTSKPKLMRPQKKTTTAVAVPAKQVKSRASLPNFNNNNNNNNNNNKHNTFVRSSAKPIKPELLDKIQADHRQKFMQLIAQQQEEQKRLQHAFETQQKMLLERLAVGMDDMNVARSPSVGMLSSLECSPQSHSYAANSENSELPAHSPSLSISSSALSHSLMSSVAVCDLLPFEESASCASSPVTALATSRHCTPRRRLFPRDPSPAGMGAMGVAVNSSTVSSSSANRRLQQQFDNQRRIAAATKICACARGFLTRRLFQTEQIQRIVQTIRDTLIFVLNLHMEAIDNEEEANTPANIKLKARLLQQLSSASRTLHLVCFQTTIKERMEIIARDRKRIQTKLLTMNMKRSPRIVA